MILPASKHCSRAAASLQSPLSRAQPPTRLALRCSSSAASHLILTSIMLPLSDVKISLSTLLEAGLVAAFVAGVVFISSSKGGKSAAAVDGAGATGANKKGKSKKKRSAGKAEQTVEEETKEKAATTQPSKASPAPKQAATAPAPTPAPKKKQAKASVPAAVPTPAPVASQAAPTPEAPSFASIATPTSTAPTPKPKKTAAEKALRPEPKSAVTDMRDVESDPLPSAARVLKVVGGKVGAKEPQPEPWGDDGWEQLEQDGDWEVAKVKSEPSPFAEP